MHAHSNAPAALARKRPSIHPRPRRCSEASLPASEPAVAIVDKHGVVSFSTPAMGNLFRSSREQLEGREVATLLPGLPLSKNTPGDNLAFAESWARAATWQKWKGRSPDGDSIALEVSLKKLSMNADEYILLAMRPAKADFGAPQELDLLIESARARKAPVMITDTDGAIHFLNPAFEETSGYTLEELRGQLAGVIITEFHDPDFYGAMRETLLAGHDFRAIFSNRRKVGEVFYEDTHIRPFIDRLGVTTHFVATGQALDDVLRTTLLRLQREACHAALTDPPNRKQPERTGSRGRHGGPSGQG